MFKLTVKKIIKILHSKFLLNLTYVLSCTDSPDFMSIYIPYKANITTNQNSQDEIKMKRSLLFKT